MASAGGTLRRAPGCGARSGRAGRELVRAQRARDGLALGGPHGVASSPTCGRSAGLASSARGAPLRPSSMAPFPSWRRRDHGGARLRQSDSRGGAEAGRAVRGAARRTARTASAAARGGPRARRRRLGVLVLPRSSLSGAPLSWLWRRPVSAAMAARGGQAAGRACGRGGLRTAASRGGTAPPRRPSSHRQRTARAQGPCKASWRASAAACARPRRTAASGGVRASARGHGERRRPRRLGRRGGRTAAARASQGRPPWCRARWPPWCRGRCRGG